MKQKISITKTQASELTDILTQVGLSDPEDFIYSLTSGQGFFGNSFEWSERGKNMRFVVNTNHAGEIKTINIYILDTRSNYKPYSDEAIAEANREANELFAN